ncbi:MAG: DUF2285 domain-containing protein [Acetobacteraceae bacterium]
MPPNLPFDAFFELRVHAARRLWRTLMGRSPGPSFRDMPSQLRQLNILRLRAFDGRQAGASYRKIAEVLLGFHGTKEDFESDPRKNKARRLVADADRLTHGGYRVFLHYPRQTETPVAFRIDTTVSGSAARTYPANAARSASPILRHGSP